MKGNFCAVGTRQATSLFSWASSIVRVAGIKETAAWSAYDHQSCGNHRDGGMTILIKYLRNDLNERKKQAMEIPLKRALPVREHSLRRLGIEISRFEEHQWYMVRLELFWVCDRSVVKDKSKVRVKDL